MNQLANNNNYDLRKRVHSLVIPACLVWYSPRRAQAGIQRARETTGFPSAGEWRIIKIMKKSYVYILTNKRNGTLYVGVTSDLIKRVYQHKNDLVAGFSEKYRTHMLVYF